MENEDSIIFKVNWPEVSKAMEMIKNTFHESGLETGNILVALGIGCVNIAYSAKMIKPHFLNEISQWWEKIDDINQKQQQHREDDYVD